MNKMAQDMKRDMNVYSKFTDMFKYQIKGTYVLRNIFLLLTLMIFGVSEAWAQAVLVQDGGYYYISIKEKDTSNPTPNNTNYYICPTENWIYFETINNMVMIRPIMGSHS